MDLRQKNTLLIIRESLEHNSLDQMRLNVIKLMERIFQCDASTFFMSDKSRKKIDAGDGIFHNLDGDLMLEYHKYFHKLDPVYRDLYLSSSVFTNEELMSRKVFKHSEYYNDFFKKLKLEYQMTVVLKSGRLLIGGIALLRRVNTNTFNTQERQLAELLVPYLSEITGKYIALNQSENKSYLLECFAKNLPFRGKIILNEFDEPIYIDDGAIQIIHSIDQDYKEKNNYMGSSLIEEIKSHAQKYIHSNSWHDEDTFSFQFCKTFGHTKRNIDVLIRPVYCPKRSKCLLIGLDPITLNTNAERNMNKSGLGQRHKEVCSLVLQGLKNNEIAGQLFISRYTVENHLKLIYQKLNVTSRASLINKLISPF